MKRRKVIEENDNLLNVSGMGDINAYDAVSNTRITLNESYDDTYPDNVVPFPDKLEKIAEFQIHDTLGTQDDFKRILFVSKALSNNKSNIEKAFYKSLIHVENVDDKKMVIATDGVRMHAAAVYLDLIPGNYTITVSKKMIALRGPIEGDEISYPNWRKIMPKNPAEIASINFRNSSLSKKNISEIITMSRKMYALVKKTDKIINIGYLDDLTKEEWKVCVDKEAVNSPMMFRKDDEKSLFALIMPIEPE